MIRSRILASKPMAVTVSLVLSSCANNIVRSPETGPRILTERADEQPSLPFSTDVGIMYSEKVDSGFKVPGLDVAGIKPELVRQVVAYPTDEKPGTIIVDQRARFLYLIQPGGTAMRYAVGVGPAARAFDGGDAVIASKAAWPRWIPTPDMVKRNPAHYGPNKDGVDGGPGNPMGARALYMHKNGKDTYYRVHGTNDPSSIGKAVSAGCIRLLNQDIIDLYERVKPGARIVVQG